MGKQLEETKLKRRKPENRRGVFTTWGSDTWQALLAKADGDVAEVLAACNAVGDVEKDVTKAVLGGKWNPPAGEWILAIQMDTQDWWTLVTSSWEGNVIEKLAADFEGQLLITGHSDFAGTVYTRVTDRDPTAADGHKMVFEFQSDGTPWDDEEDDEFEDDEFDEEEFESEEDRELAEAIEKVTMTSLIAEDLTLEALQEFEQFPDAHQAVIRHLDAYVPGLFYLVEDSELSAPFGHDDILPHITRIDLLRLGKVTADEPKPKALAATRRLHKAIQDHDLRKVEKAIKDGAILSPIDKHSSALYTAVYSLAYKPFEPRAEIVRLLLASGADPNDNEPHSAEVSYADTPLARMIGRRPPFEHMESLARELVDAGADLNSKSPYPLQLGERPLHSAAKKALVDWVNLLLELGADPKATSDAGRTPRESVEDLVAAKAESDFYTDEDVAQERRDYAPILELLEVAENS